MTVAAPSPRPALAAGLAAGLLAAGLVGAAFGEWRDVFSSLGLGLLALSATAGFLSSAYSSDTWVSPAFVVGMLAIALLGPSEAFWVATVGIFATWPRVRFSRELLLINLAAVGPPTLLVGQIFHTLVPTLGGPGFYAAIAVSTIVVFGLNTILIFFLGNLHDGARPLTPDWGAEIELLPSVLISGGLAALLAGAYVQWGLPSLVIAVLVIATIYYMERLVSRSREQTRQYANLSWGVLSGLVRTLNERDHRASRHCAAVAMFSRDIAELCGFDEHDQELAHTAGLLHDIGKFTLSDRVMERGAQLDESDWRGIRRHPDIGADLLKDIGVFGPVGEIVRCHHERLDGRGYPRGLTGDEIPEVAKIVAVAEVYDTLTAPDTYRTPMNSFEALNELRRVSGSQLEGRYVDALAKLLAGRGTDYRHQDEADFDRELDMERRMSEAATPV